MGVYFENVCTPEAAIVSTLTMGGTGAKTRMHKKGGGRFFSKTPVPDHRVLKCKKRRNQQPDVKSRTGLTEKTMRPGPIRTQ